MCASSPTCICGAHTVSRTHPSKDAESGASRAVVRTCWRGIASKESRNRRRSYLTAAAAVAEPRRHVPGDKYETRPIAGLKSTEQSADRHHRPRRNHPRRFAARSHDVAGGRAGTLVWWQDAAVLRGRGGPATRRTTGPKSKWKAGACFNTPQWRAAADRILSLPRHNTRTRAARVERGRVR